MHGPSAPLARRLLAILLATAALLANAAAAPIFDDLDEPAAWTGPVFQYGNSATGSAWFTNSTLTIRHSPVGRWHTVSMSRTWEADPRQGLWVHFRFRIKEMLLGADLYATVSFGDEMVLQMGVNGEQHWVQGGSCQEKEFDDELFWGSNVIVGEGHKRTDIRVGLTDGPPLRYTDWTLVSMGYEASGADRRIRLFVNGREVVYRDLDAAAPAGAVDNRVRAECLRLDKPVPVTVTFANFTDGDLYADTTVNNGDGIRWLRAFAANTPAKPHRSDPAKAEAKDSDMEFDFVLMHRPGETNALPEAFGKLARTTPLWPAVARGNGRDASVVPRGAGNADTQEAARKTSEALDGMPGRRSAAAAAPEYAWEQIAARAVFAARDGAGALAFQGRMWLLGGWNPNARASFPRVCGNDVWSSRDGVEWTCHLPSAPWPPREYHNVAVFDNRMWVLAGYHEEGGNRKDVWHSPDGLHWEELRPTPWAPRHAASVFVHDDALWVVAGNNMEPDVWKLKRRPSTP